MTTKFTPGPWRAVDVLQGDEGNLIDDNYNSIAAGDGFTDAETYSVGFQISGCISRADANLIAAAPDMYEALKACRLQLLQSNNNTEYAQEACDMAKAALAKAQGGAA